ncbi:hypothetical protein H0266_02600 [Halobacillus locisalis]|uniref:Uncharacterized protein n=1 Tax=Halobacillus locisalis TaxID=220753 RepID=A0A838CP54_9BACI|nr:hypothetical protein [Halobacillus locisalis]MBA2173780.1 hypothetical protein [Halobacillus locisalis]
MIHKPFRNLFGNKSWELVFSTHDLIHYYKRVGALKNEGIEIKTKTLSCVGGKEGATGLACIYQVYVRRPVIHQAYETLEL